MDTLEDLQERIAEYIESSPVSALALGVIRGDEYILESGFGDANVTLDTAFPSCSTGKTLTATAVMRLVQEGRLDLDRPVTDYLPELT